MRKSKAVLFTALLAGGALVSGTAAAQNTAAQTTLDYIQPLSPQAVQAVQQSLRHQGVYTGPIDGVWGESSREALERFQATHQLQPTGQLNQATAGMLGLNATTLIAPEMARTEPVPPVGSLSPGAVRTVQGRLRELGFYHGSVDGVWGASTQEAIQQFQQGRGLQPNGQLNPTTVAALGLAPEALATR